MPNFQVNEIYRAIQGEGYHTGVPVTIVRFHGCNLSCDFCDTKYALEPASYRYVINLPGLLHAIESAKGTFDKILITGGEPTLQPLDELVKFCPHELHLETNGTRRIPGGFDWVTISPKYKPVIPAAMMRANEIKWLIATDHDVDALLDFVSRWNFQRIVSVQPISQDPVATKIAYQAVQDHGWRLSLQTHKFIERK